MNVRFSVAVCFLAIALASKACPQTRAPSADKDIADLEKQYQKAVQLFKEPRLSEVAADSQAEVYRMMIFPVWGDAFSIRVQKHNGIYALSSRRLDPKDGRLIEQKDLNLTETDSKALDDLIQKLGLFEMPPRDAMMGTDGDEWVIEGVSQGKYHFVERWCATEYDPKKRGLANFDASANSWWTNRNSPHDQQTKGTS